MRRKAHLLCGVCALLLSLPSMNPVKAATVEGRVTITHRITKPALRPVAAAYRRGVMAPESTAARDWLRDELDRVAIYVESAVVVPSRPLRAEIEQRGRQFSPQTLVVPQGSTVSFPNFDPIFHNVFSFSKAGTFDLGNYPKGETRVVEFRKAGMVKVYCHLHPHMRAVIVVTPNDLAAKPDETGAYRIDSLPRGEHTLVVWHPVNGFVRRKLVVDESDRVVLDFEIPLEAGLAGGL